MGLVDYSDSDSGSDTEQPQPPTKNAPPTAAQPAAQAPPNKAFRKAVDRSKSGKILVNLPTPSTVAAPVPPGDDEPPAKRARTGAASVFSGFNAMLPPPKHANKAPAVASSSAAGGSRGTVPRPGVSLKTSGEVGFSREAAPAPSSGGVVAGPTIEGRPGDQKPAAEVKLVGKPLMFKPLSVARKGQKKSATGVMMRKTVPQAPKSVTQDLPQPTTTDNETNATDMTQPSKEPPKKTSLFSFQDTQTTPVGEEGLGNDDAYNDYEEDDEGFDIADAGAQDEPNYPPPLQPPPSSVLAPGAPSLDSIADDLNLSASDRRQLLRASGGLGGGGRASAPAASGANIVNYSVDAEYARNEALRASGEAEAQQYKTVKSIAPGKHSLTQLVRAVQSQKDALEDSFAKGKSNRKEAGARYGWR